MDFNKCMLSGKIHTCGFLALCVALFTAQQKNKGCHTHTWQSDTHEKACKLRMDLEYFFNGWNFQNENIFIHITF